MDNSEIENVEFENTDPKRKPKIDIDNLNLKTPRGATKSYIDIDWNKVKNLLIAHAESGAAIAGIIGIDKNTLYQRCKLDQKITFEELKMECRQRGKDTMRARMYSNALNGNTTMQIFWAKNHLGMSDKLEQKIEIKNEIDLTLLSDAEITTFIELTEKCKVNQNNPKEIE